MLEWRLVDAATLRDYFIAIEPMLYRYPAVDAVSFGKAVAAIAAPERER